MAEPRFLCIGGPVQAGSREARRDDWGVREPTPTLWRLLGANNRELGRSAQFYVDDRACRHGVAILRRRVTDLVPALSCDTGGRWVWRLDDQNRPIAVAARPYLRQREAVYNLQQFLAAVPIARTPHCAAPPAPDTEAAE